ncbi:MAG: hypothetical protein CV087_17380 [Candidatus Brocadia sp. WS118]|nr:MAG: hypothetical protein CV087_17380 [Candidatus Brocadia sp. WS118]
MHTNVMSSDSSGLSVAQSETPTTAIPKISGGAYHSMALKSNGSVWTWGSNEYTQLGDGTNTNRSNPIQVSGLSGVITIDGGGGHNLALKLDGTVWAWGGNWSGQLGDGTKTNRNTPVQVAGLSSINIIDAGDSHSLALKSDGAVYVWGRNIYGQLGDGSTTDRSTPVQMTGLSSVTAIAGGWGHSLALKSDGTVWAWGYNNHGQLGDGTTIDRNTPVQVSGLSSVIAIACGDDHSIALKSDGSVWAWGNNGNGALGDGTTTDRTTPVQMSGLSGITAIAGGSNHTIALKSDGTVWVCGDYGWVHSGNGVSFWYRTAPVQFTDISGIVAIAAGRHHLVALKPDGTVWTWGSNWHGELGDGTDIDRTIPVQVDINLGEMTIPPMVTTGTTSNITSNSATLNGTVNANGLNTTAWFEYGTTSGAYNSTSSTQTVSGWDETTISISISGLSAGTTYYYRIAAQNSAGTTYGSEMSFPTPTPTDTHTLTVASSNPNSGVSITVSPNDNNGQGNGTTPFSRTYNANTTVTLTAPLTAGGNSFQKWQRNGVDLTTSQTANVTMNANYTMMAVYATFPTPTPTVTPTPTPTRIIRLEGDLSFGEVQVGSSAQRTMTIYNDGNATLMVNSISYPTGFSGSWGSGTIAAGSSQPVPVSFTPTEAKVYNGNVTVISTATSGTNTKPISGTGTFKPISTLTVASSNPNSGVPITVSPNDNNGLGNDATQFTRTYNNNTSVTLTAPLTAGGNSFQKWQRNGVDLTTSQTANVTMNANYTMMAVYATFADPTPTPGMTGNIAGQVTDSITGAGINGATITLDTGESATSSTVQGQDGVYSIPGISVGQHTITAFASNYATSSQIVIVEEGAPNPQTGKNIFNFTLTPTCNATNLDAKPEPLKLLREGSAGETVTVTCGNGEPKAGILVTATVRNGKKRVSVSPSSAVTDTNGHAIFTITARKNTGNAKVRFDTADGLRDNVSVKVSE